VGLAIESSQPPPPFELVVAGECSGSCPSTRSTTGQRPVGSGLQPCTVGIGTGIELISGDHKSFTPSPLGPIGEVIKTDAYPDHAV